MDGTIDVIDRPALRAGPIFLLLACYFLLNIAIRLSLPPSLELDEAEQVFYSQWWMLGYGPQPPLYNWLQTAVFTLLGRSVFALSLLKNGLIFSCYVFYWLAAGHSLKDRRLQVVAVLALLTLPQVSFMAQQDLTHTVALLSAAALFLYAFYRILAAPDTLGYMLAGLAIGFGCLAKYNFPLLPVAALLAMLPEPALRDRVFTLRLAWAIVLPAVMLAPHAVWLLANLDMATTGTLRKMNESGEGWSLLTPLQGAASLSVAILAFSALTLVLFAAVYQRSAVRVLKAQSLPIRVTERMLFLLLIGLLLVIVATGAIHIRERWLDPFLLVLPLYLAMKIEASGLSEKVTRKALIAIPILIMLAVPASLYLRVATASLTGKYTKINIPFDSLADAIEREGVTPGVVVAEDRHLAGNLLLALKDVPVMTVQLPGFVLPFEWKNGRPTLLVWRTTSATAEMPEALRQWAAQNMDAKGGVAAKTVRLPYHYAKGEDAYSFAYAWLYPAKQTQAQ
jgi:4-amino-4-deoxy-L-arabinose transferase-like glycosyltransferase